MSAHTTAKSKRARGARKDNRNQTNDVPSDGARRFIIACAASALCLAAVGMWMVPAEDSASRLIKLAASLGMVGGALLLFNGLNAGQAVPGLEVDPAKRQLRVYEYDAKGRSRLKATYHLDDLHDVSVKNRHLSANDANGVLVLEMPLGSAEVEGAVKAAMTAKP
ncbi:MAG: hypothetical protein AAF484_08020 [Pseudomonadota bacterium]